MGVHTFGFAGAKTDSTANENIAAPADASLTRTANGNQYLMPYDAQIIWAAALNDTITSATLQYPSYRDVGVPYISPLNPVAAFTGEVFTCQWGDNGPRVRKTEELGAQVSNGASTVDTAAVLLSISDGKVPLPAGRRFTVHGTTTQTLVANAWTLGGITLDQTLPFGRYGVIGLEFTGSNAILGRLVFTANTYYRPGAVTHQTVGLGDRAQIMRYGRQGLLGTFDQTSPPNCELLGFTAGAQTYQVILDLVQMSGG